ncbi:MAG TPA: LLM class flavin-dependent oxidoreductase [Actinopolymorphaceae bacterium]|jgi:alkanesulfonate monooxygenase
MKLNWFLPLSHDVTHIGTWPEQGPEPTLDHLTSIVTSAEESGFSGLLVPTSYLNHREAFTTSAAVLARTSKAELLIAVRPNQFHPAQAAKMFASLHQLFPGRIRLNVTTGGWGEDRFLGVDDDRETRYKRLHEWLAIVDGILYGNEALSYDGEIYHVAGAYLLPPMQGRIPVAMSGSAPEARAALVRYADTYLLFGRPPAEVADEIAQLRATPGFRRDITVGLRVHVIVRPTEDEAWAAADDLISKVDPRVRKVMAAQQHAPGSQRKAQHDLASRSDLVVSPNLWAGVGTARFGVATALVGTPDQIIDRLEEYAELGVSEFILSGYPKLREVRRFGDLVTPRLVARGLL